jgi:hypothetical protein
MNEMLATYELNTKVLAYIKAKGKNLLAMNIALTFVVSCEVLGLIAPFIKNFWGHAKIQAKVTHYLCNMAIFFYPLDNGH